VPALIEVPLAQGGSVLVEVDGDDGPVVRGRGVVPPVGAVAEPLEQVMAGLGPVTQALISQVRTMTDTPAEVELEFAVKLTAEAKVVIVRAAGEANFRVALRWTQRPDPPTSDHTGA
jgi:hypothetical protein